VRENREGDRIKDLQDLQDLQDKKRGREGEGARGRGSEWARERMGDSKI
jgi:hypothetical protein